jgi:uroporphyrinogen-III synthase
MAGSPLKNRRILITRADPGALRDLLHAAGAEMVHIPLISMNDPEDGGQALRAALGDLAPGDWLVVTSPEGARRVVKQVSEMGPTSPMGSKLGELKIAAVGRATAAVVEEAIGSSVDLIPDIQLASELAIKMGAEPAGQRVLVAHGDLAHPHLVDALRAYGHDVIAVVAYRTVLVPPTAQQIAAASSADALVLASGSAARSWALHCKEITPAVICSMGPSTTLVAHEVGLVPTHQAEVSSVEGIMACLNQAFDADHPTMG